MWEIENASCTAYTRSFSKTNNKGHVECRRDPYCPAQSTALRLRAPYCLDAEARKCRLLREPAEHEFVQECFVNIRRQIGCLVCRRHICNRVLNPFVNRGCEKGVDFALMRPADHDCHA